MKKLDRIMVIGGALLLSGTVITGLAMAAAHGIGHNGGHLHKMKAQKLDQNGDGLIGKDEMLARYVTRFRKLDADGNGTISIDEFNARPIAMFSRMDKNADGFLSDDEMPRRRSKRHKSGCGHHGQNNGAGGPADHCASGAGNAAAG